MSNFTWLPFFEEMLNVICTKYDKESLCKVFHEIFSDSGGREDFLSDGTKGLLREIDPLTFIAYFNRGERTSDEKRIKYCDKSKEIFSLKNSCPKDFTGIPFFNAQLTWFFGWERDNRSEWKENLWIFARQLNADNITPDLFYNILQISNVGKAKLTQFMFICKPDKYISLDGKNIDYFRHKNINAEQVENIKNLSKGFGIYKDFIKEIKEKFPNKTLYEISYEAYLYGKNKKNDFEISDEQFAELKKRFDSRISGFVDFQNPGEDFKDKELSYKRNALNKYQEEACSSLSPILGRQLWK
jgi:hypothetical protein